MVKYLHKMVKDLLKMRNADVWFILAFVAFYITLALRLYIVYTGFCYDLHNDSATLVYTSICDDLHDVSVTVFYHIKHGTGV